ncbi:hypothetical protein SADUNF_Sadunf08G0141600 [Salix dunnii]|uniref:Uncharacterized protein n=1 Tax=Salix dunnii TaxID=1413687 RepID=A0A835MY66_9ROSI|nr:hypothetical protein SADUNF_Sadunf08G0141600 [Salix dunnii]
MPVDLAVSFQMKGSTVKHGISLHTLIRKSAALSGPCFLVCHCYVLTNSIYQGWLAIIKVCVWWVSGMFIETYCQAKITGNFAYTVLMFNLQVSVLSFPFSSTFKQVFEYSYQYPDLYLRTGELLCNSSLSKRCKNQFITHTSSDLINETDTMLQLPSPFTYGDNRDYTPAIGGGGNIALIRVWIDDSCSLLEKFMHHRNRHFRLPSFGGSQIHPNTLPPRNEAGLRKLLN